MKTYFATFWTTFWDKFGYFLFQNQVALIILLRRRQKYFA